MSHNCLFLFLPFSPVAPLPPREDLSVRLCVFATSTLLISAFSPSPNHPRLFDIQSFLVPSGPRAVYRRVIYFHSPSLVLVLSWQVFLPNAWHALHSHFFFLFFPSTDVSSCYFAATATCQVSASLSTVLFLRFCSSSSPDAQPPHLNTRYYFSLY